MNFIVIGSWTMDLAEMTIVQLRVSERCICIFMKWNFQLDHCDWIYAYDTRWNLDTATQNATGKWQYCHKLFGFLLQQ